MLPEKGIYLAGIVQSGLKAPEGKCPSFDIYFECKKKLEGGEWVDANGERITESFNVIKRDDSINEINVRMLKESLGWDGASFVTLNETDWSAVDVQIRVDDETGSDGKSYRCVKYLNHKDYTGPNVVGKADAQSVTSLDQKYGAMLRALTGAPKNGAKASAGTTKKVGAKAPVVAGITSEQAKGACWKAFSDKVDQHTKDFPDDKWTNDQKVEVFKTLITEAFPGKTSATLALSEWQEFLKQIEKDFSPATRALLPF